MTEQNAFLGFFRAPWSNVKIFVGADGKVYPVSFGKAECEWVPFRETWQHKFPSLGLTTFEESEPKSALGMAPGSTWTEAQIRVTEVGVAVRERFYAAVAQAIEAKAATEIDGSAVGSADAPKEQSMTKATELNKDIRRIRGWLSIHIATTVAKTSGQLTSSVISSTHAVASSAIAPFRTIWRRCAMKPTNSSTVTWATVGRP